MDLSQFSSPEFIINPYPFYEEVRSLGAVVPISPHIVISARYESVREMLHDSRIGKDHIQSIRIRYGEEASQGPVFQSFSRMMLMLDPPVHYKVRSLLTKAFTAQRVESLRETIQNISNRLINNLVNQLKKHKEIDLAAEYAFKLPVEIICKLLNIPVQDGEKYGEAARKSVQALNFTPLTAQQISEANAAILSLENYFSKVIAERHKKTGDDLISALLTTKENDIFLSDDEIISNVILMFIAGHETTSNMISNALISLYKQPEQLNLLRNDSSLMPKAVTECLRLDSSVQIVGRVALNDLEISGFHIKCGTIIFLMIGAANRDP
ncbi:putative cytochrome P450 hydroxylase [Liberibacter crescens BT-1]|uniref:Putative cytochrome P450 hydroxylase n=1 Tax=Liberibacter crescens (strain BT-1) TaxID=1215343 RepID=L0ETX6_LIBCB|nr:putative cytochrome P450 hydroxylase [Liberibacter crescens BT-1]